MTNLLIDCSYIEKAFVASGSLVIYAARLIQGFQKYGHCRIHVLLWQEMEDTLDQFVGQEYEKIVLDRDKMFTSWRPYYRLLGVLPRQLKQELKIRNISTVLLPIHLFGFFYFSPPYRHYAIVHDLILYDNVKKERGMLSYFIWHKYRSMLTKKFPHLISISKATHDELLRRDGKESEIVYNSIPFDFTDQELPIEDITDKQYILDVNRFHQTKNAELLIHAFSLIKNDIPHILYLKGDHKCEKERKELEKLSKELGLSDRIVFDHSFRTEGEMRYLYSHADLFVSPSLQEGFGWTPIEAAVNKTPVLISNIEVLKEVSCNKIPTFAPHSPENLAKQILTTLQNPPSEQEKTDLAKFYIERYSLRHQIKQLEKIMGL